MVRRARPCRRSQTTMNARKRMSARFDRTAQIFPQLSAVEPVVLAGKPGATSFLGRRRGFSWAWRLCRSAAPSHGRPPRKAPARPRIDVHHHFIPQFHVDFMMAPGRRAGAAAAEVVAGAVARGHGQERDRDLDPVDRPARHLVRQQCRRIPASSRRELNEYGAKMVQGSSRPLRPVRRASRHLTSTAACRRSNTPSTRSRLTASDC